MVVNSINNNAHPYYFPADIAKEGDQYVRISDYLKVRVHDNGKVVPFKWYDQGRVMNVHGFVPFIHGLIGKYVPDDNNEVIMASDAVWRDWQGSAANSHDGGIVDYILEDQMFPQEGIFKGHFGLKDSNGNVLTSVNIIFEVLGNDLRIGETTKYYSSELDKMVKNFEVRTNQVVKEANEKLEKETSEMHGAAVAAQAEVSAVRADSQKLAGTLGDLQAQINSNGLETIINHNADIDKISHRIDDRLARISTETPTFPTLDELKAKYPVGTDGLFRVGDRGFMWKNNQWEDIGQLPSANVADEDFNERVGMFIVRDDTESVTIKETFNPKTKLWSGSMNIPQGSILYLGNHGDYYTFDKKQDVNFGYYSRDVENRGLAAFYFDGISNIYADFEPARRNDIKLFNIYDGRIYAGSTQGITVNNIPNGGWEYGNGSVMAINDGKRINVTYADGSYTVSIPKSMNIYTAYGNRYTNLNEQKLTSKDSLTNLYFDFRNRAFYLSAKNRKDTDLFIASLYQNHAYSADVQAFVVNGMESGGFSHKNNYAYAMFLPLWGNQPISVTYNAVDGNLNHYVVDIPKNSISLDLSGNKKEIQVGKLDFTCSNTQIANLYVSSIGTPYIDFSSHSSSDNLIASLFNKFVYGINTDNFVVNGISQGGWGNTNNQAALMQINDGKAIEVKTQGKYVVSVPKGLNLLKSDGQTVNTPSAQVVESADRNSVQSLFYDKVHDTWYLDSVSHNSLDILITTLYQNHAYGSSTRGIIVDGYTDGGFGTPYGAKLDLNDWRIAAKNGKPANIAWLGDSTYQGYKTSSPDRVAGNYLNKLLPNDYTGVTSYVCAIGGYTTWDLYNHFDELLKLNNANNIGLVLIGGGLNDRGDITKEQYYLDLIVKKVRAVNATPVIVTTQATAVLNSDRASGDDWTGVKNINHSLTNQVRREYARMYNIDLIDLEKFQNEYVEYGPAKFNEMFDDYLHGHDNMHKFGAEYIFSKLTEDKIDIIEKPKVISVTTMKAESDMFAHQSNKQLINAELNSKGFKASLTGEKVSLDKTIIDYQFFIPASEEQYYLNGYNLGPAVNVLLNGDLTQLTGNATVSFLNPGYYHVIVKPASDSVDFAGLRIEKTKLDTTTVQPSISKEEGTE